MRILPLLAGCLLSPVLLQGASERTQVLQVGDLGNLDTLVLEGLRSFTEEEVKQALASDPLVAVASHPCAPLEGLLERLTYALKAGFLSEGFPEAEVSVQHDVENRRIRARVAEGPRFRCGRIAVTGAENVPVQPILQALMEGEKPLWPAGEPASFCPEDPRKLWIQEAVGSALSDQGFFFPDFSVETLRDPPSGLAELRIQVPDPGPAGTLGVLRVRGDGAPSQETLMAFLGLSPGMPVNAALVERIRDRLWRSARFLDQQVSPLRPVNPSDGIDLEIKLLANPWVSETLDSPLPPEAEALVRMAGWLNRYDTASSEEDLEIRIGTEQTPHACLVLSREGAVFNLEPGEGMALTGFSALLDGRRFCLASDASKHRLSGDLRTASVTATMEILASPQPGEEKPFRFKYGMGIIDRPALQTPEGAQAALDLDLRFDPTAVLGGMRKHGAVYSRKDGVLQATVPDGMTLVVEEATGRLVEAGITDGSCSISIRFGKGIFGGIAGELGGRVEPYVNDWDPGCPLSSSGAFLFRELGDLLGKRDDADPFFRTWIPILRLLGPKVLAPLDPQGGMAPDEAPDEDSFGIPFEGEGSARFAPFAAPFRELFSRGTWPWWICQETVMVLEGEWHYLPGTAQMLYDSKETGPLFYLAASEILDRIGRAKGSRLFASAGLECLDCFNLDCEAFLKGDSRISRTLVLAAKTLREMPGEDLEALTKGLPPEYAEGLKGCAATLRQSEEEELRDVLPEALNALWKAALKDRVRAGLERRAQ